MPFLACFACPPLPRNSAKHRQTMLGAITRQEHLHYHRHCHLAPAAQLAESARHKLAGGGRAACPESSSMIDDGGQPSADLLEESARASNASVRHRLKPHQSSVINLQLPPSLSPVPHAQLAENAPMCHDIIHEVTYVVVSSSSDAGVTLMRHWDDAETSQTDAIPRCHDHPPTTKT